MNGMQLDRACPARTDGARPRWLRIAGTTTLAGFALAAAGSAQEAVANGEVAVDGTVAGSYVDTWTGDGIREQIREVESGGKPSNRTGLLEHKWTFDVPAGASATLLVRAHHDANAEGDDFVLAWSTDDASYVDLLTITKTSDDGGYQSALLDTGISGPLYVRARDTDRTPGNRGLDALYVDHLYVETGQTSGPPAAPGGLEATLTEAAGYDGLQLTWTDNSGNEDGFRIERSLDGVAWDPLVTVGADVTAYADTGLLPESAYSYVVQAYNGDGDSAGSNVASATTLPPVAFTSELVDPAGAFYFGLAYDPLGRQAIGYVSDDVLWFAQWSGAGWDIEAVDEAQAGVELAFLPDGRPCLSYGWGEMRFAEKTGESWSIDVVEPGNHNDFNSLVIDPDGNPSIAYTDTGSRIGKVKFPGGLRLATRIAGSWFIEVVDEAERPAYKSLAYDALGRPSIAYDGWDGERDYLKFARWTGASWDLEVAETDGVDDCGLFPSLAYDPLSGEPAIVHERRPWGGLGEVRFVRWDGAAWQAELVVPQALSPAGLAFTSLGSPYFCYRAVVPRAPDLAGLWVTHQEGAAWVHELAVVWGSGDGQLALDPDERPSVAWSSFPEGLRFAQR